MPQSYCWYFYRCLLLRWSLIQELPFWSQMSLEKYSNDFSDVKKPLQHCKNCREINRETKNNNGTWTQRIFSWHINTMTLEDGRSVFEWKFLIVWRRNFSIVSNLGFAIKKSKLFSISCHLFWDRRLFYHPQEILHNATAKKKKLTLHKFHVMVCCKPDQNIAWKKFLYKNWSKYATEKLLEIKTCFLLTF